VTLDALAHDLRTENPGHTFVVDEGVVWLRHEGQDFGIYAAVIAGQVVRVWNRGRTPIHRATPGRTDG